MEEELQKRNTDCVYFLASPLTCKKGIDCEYRHNEVARLNSRDCWYWLSGNCINPSCGFRHPPLDGHVTEAPSESASLPCQPSLPVNKTSVPCYFYFNSFCNKGDRCSFLHGPDGSAPVGKPSKAPAATNDALSPKNKTSGGNGIRSAPAKTYHNPSEITSKQAMDTKTQKKNDLLLSSPGSVPQRSASPMMSLSGCEEDTIINSDSMEPVGGFVKNKSHLYTDWSHKDQVNNHFEPVERRESSPAFDVLVENDNKSENLGYEDDPEYLLAINREQRELNFHILGYDFEDQIEYDHMHPDDTCNYMVNQPILDDSREHPSHSRGRILTSILSRNRKLLSLKLALDDHRVDLRDYLRKRRFVDCRSVIHSTRGRELYRLIGQKLKRPRTNVIGGWLHGKLASEVGKNHKESCRDKRTFSKHVDQHGWPRHSKSNTLRQHYREKRQASRVSDLSVSRGPFPRERISCQISSTFTGPKTLAEIKEEKKKAEKIGDCFGEMGNLTRTWVDFQGPKPLSEILEEKRRSLDTLQDGGFSS